MNAVGQLREAVGVKAACGALELARSTYYRALHRPPPQAARPWAPSPRALDPEERSTVLEVLHSERFVDRSPAEVYATLLDEERYLCSVRTMYRILEANQEVRERRNQCRHPTYRKPELLATGPNQVWSWDLTKLRAPEKWAYYYLYVVLDVFSRYVVAWMLAHRESGELATRLFDQAAEHHHIEPGQLTVHSDRGSAPTAKTLAQLYADLGMERSLSRPHVSDDNPFSEAQFKTMKYAPGYPPRFGSYEHARSWCRHFFLWYNTEHRHSGIAYLTPATVHYGQADATLETRRRVLAKAQTANPERFVHGAPSPQPLPAEVWINPPEDRARTELQTCEAAKSDHDMELLH